MDWNDVLGKTITHELYDQFIKKFSFIYDDCFPTKVIEIKKKSPQSLDYKRHKKVIQEKTETVQKLFEKEVPKKIKLIQRL